MLLRIMDAKMSRESVKVVTSYCFLVQEIWGGWQGRWVNPSKMISQNYLTLKVICAHDFDKK